VVVTACPTAYWSRKPELIVRDPNSESAGFSFRQSLYSNDPNVYKAQFSAIETVRDKFGKVTVVLQGEEVLMQRYLEAKRWGAEHEARIAHVEGTTMRLLSRKLLREETLRREVHEEFVQYTRPHFLNWFLDNSFFSYDIGEYLQMYRSQGMMVGCRLHSNLVSLANGTPTFLLTYDQRTQELAELMSIPHCALMDFGPDTDVLGQDWRPFEKSYRFLYSEMRRFLDSNNLPHRLEG
jgi:hypothetical protein